MILLNPGPANTTETVKLSMTRPDICPREREFCDVLVAVRDDLTRVVHKGEAYVTVMIGGSGTAAVESAIVSVVPHTGSLLVIENGSYGVRIADICRAYGISHDVMSFGVGGYPDIARIENELDKNIHTHLAIVHHETSTGLLNPVETIGAICRKKNVCMLVDAMSSFAGVPIDIECMNADYLISSSNKCIQGMAGIGFVVCRRQAIDSLDSSVSRSYYLNLAQQHRYFELHRQMQFTPPVQVVYALQQALEEFFEETPIGRYERYRTNWEAMNGVLKRLGFKSFLADEHSSRLLTAVIEPNHPNYTFDGMHDRLLSKGFTIYPGKGAEKMTFRLANIGQIGPEDIESFEQAMSSTLMEMNVWDLYVN